MAFAVRSLGVSSLVAAGLTLGFVAGPARAASEAVYAAVTGKWLFASEATGKGCVVTLSQDQAIGGRTITGMETCRGPVGLMAEALAWDFTADGGIVFRDATRKLLLTLKEDADGSYFEAGKPAGQRFVFKAANEGQERIFSAREIFGTWEFRRPGGGVLCTVTFANSHPAKRPEFYEMTTQPGCDPGLVKLQLVKWHIEAALLVLVGAETADLSLVPKANGHFVKSAKEGGKPLELVKK